MPSYTALKDAGAFVKTRTPFFSDKVHAEVTGSVYAVYSYGPHFPMYVYCEGTWYRNTDKSSAITDRHMNMCHPGDGLSVGKTTKELRQLIDLAGA